MMKNFARIIAFLLVFINVFIIGTSLAVVLGAGKDQGLAAAPIAMGYGLLLAVLGLLGLVAVHKSLSSRQIVALNIVLAIGLFAFALIAYLRAL